MGKEGGGEGERREGGAGPGGGERRWWAKGEGAWPSHTILKVVFFSKNGGRSSKKNISLVVRSKQAINIKRKRKTFRIVPGINSNTSKKAQNTIWQDYTHKITHVPARPQMIGRE